MLPTAAQDPRLAALRRRWEEDRSPSAAIPLAEEYRRRSLYEEGEAVLTASLELYPRHLSVLVALGRIRLEAGDGAGAVEALVRVVERDPMQLVANRLLGEAYLAVGRPEEAEKRIRVYALLNDRDPELPALQRRLRDALQQSVPSAPPETADETVPDLWVEDDLDAPRAESAATTPIAPAAAHPAVWVETVAEVDPPVAAAAVHVASEVFRLGAATEPSGSAAEAGHVWRRLAEPSPRTAPAEEDAIVFPTLLHDTARQRYLAAWRDAGPFASLGAGTSETGNGGAAPTVTLGELYLQQGHREDAGAVFREILAREPGNDAARRGLVRVQGSDGTASPDRSAVAGPSAEPAQRLRAYLERLRVNARASHHVS